MIPGRVDAHDRPYACQCLSAVGDSPPEHCDACSQRETLQDAILAFRAVLIDIDEDLVTHDAYRRLQAILANLQLVLIGVTGIPEEDA